MCMLFNPLADTGKYVCSYYYRNKGLCPAPRKNPVALASARHQAGLPKLPNVWLGVLLPKAHTFQVVVSVDQVFLYTLYQITVKREKCSGNISEVQIIAESYRDFIFHTKCKCTINKTLYPVHTYINQAGTRAVVNKLAFYKSIMNNIGNHYQHFMSSVYKFVYCNVNIPYLQH